MKKVKLKNKVVIKKAKESKKQTGNRTKAKIKTPKKPVQKPEKQEKTEKPVIKIKRCGKCKRPKIVCKCGRPTKYSDEILLKTREYIDSCQPIEVSRVKGESARGMTYQLGMRPNYPKVGNLALKLKVNPDTIYEWGNKHEEFSELLREMKLIQENRLEEFGLSGEIDAGLSKFILSARYGMAEKKDHRIETAAGLFADDEDDE